MLRRIPVPAAHRVPGGRTNSYLVGDPAVLVDPAGDSQALGIDPETIAHVVVTHTHPDHVVGVEALRQETDATVWSLGSYRERFVAQTGVEPDRTFRAGDELDHTGVSVMALPGHTPDHVGFVLQSEILVGDVARAGGSVMIDDIDGDMRAYLTTLRRLLHHRFDAAYPGHGPAIEDPEERFSDLLAHRLDRERRVELAVLSGSRTPGEIVEAAYEKDLTGLESAAARTVRAHLAKLAVEGRVSWEGSRATPP